MIKNYLKIAFRNLWKSRGYSVLNILGLAIGMGACLLILQYVDFEMSYDKMHQEGDRIVRVSMTKYEQNEEAQTFAFTYPAVAPNIVRDFAEVEDAVRIRLSGGIMRYADQQFLENNLAFVDSSFFRLFNFPVLEGDAHTALSRPYQGALSRSTAEKYFGSENPLGKMVEFGQSGFQFEVAAVYEDMPANSHFQFDLLISYVSYIQRVAQGGGDAENNWNWSDFYTYLMLAPKTDLARFQAKMPEFVQRYKGEDMARNNYEMDFILQPLKDIHLRSNLGYELQANGNIRYVSFLVIIGLFVLLIAWFNYINLSTARSIDRAREVGVRKVVGAKRGQLIRQFLLETAIVNFLALTLAFLLVEMAISPFSRLIGKEMTFSLIETPAFWLILLGIFGGGVILAGLYPAFVLSDHRPITTLKGGMANSSVSGVNLRKGLVFFQFVATISLIAGTFAVYRQMQFMRWFDLGVDIQENLVIQNFGSRDSTYVETSRSLKESLARRSDISGVVVSGDIPGKEVGNSTSLRWTKSPSPSMKRSRTFAVDDAFIDHYGLELIAGRPFSNDFGTEENMLILNETAVSLLGFESPEAALNEEITNESYFSGRVVGVIKDYHQESLQFGFKPIIFYYNEARSNYYSIKVNTSRLPETLAYVEQQWKAHFPDAPFAYFFLDEYFDRQYRSDQQFGNIFGLFTLLAIIVACLGLFGLSSFSVSRRTKEIGIRKVLGASISQILLLISREYLALILVAGVVAVPIAWVLMQKWLMNYAYSINLGLWFLLLPMIMVTLIAAITVSYQSIRAAVANPVESLKYE